MEWLQALLSECKLQDLDELAAEIRARQTEPAQTPTQILTPSPKKAGEKQPQTQSQGEWREEGQGLGSGNGKRPPNSNGKASRLKSSSSPDATVSPAFGIVRRGLGTRD